jgi:hypothetical protein
LYWFRYQISVNIKHCQNNYANQTLKFKKGFVPAEKLLIWKIRY